MKRAVLELCIFSGRPNPSWEIQVDAALEIYQFALSLPQTEPGKSFEGLGYRGFILIFQEDNLENFSCSIYLGLVMIKNGKTVVYKRDKQLILENRLLKWAEGNVDESLLLIVHKELNRGH